MRKFVTSLAALALCAAFASTCSATVLLSESFNYANGNLVPNNGWANYSGAATDIQIASGRATGGAIGNPQNDDHKLFPVQPTTTKTYACFEVTIPAVAAQPKPIYFAELKDAGSASLVSRVYVVPVAPSSWTFAISHSSTGATAGCTLWGSTLSYDTRYQLVINYDPVTKSSKLWVNPVNEASTNVTDTNAAIAALAVQGFGLRQSNAASAFPASQVFTGTGDWNWSVDNLGVGTTFDDACFQITPNKGHTWGQLKTLYR